MNKQQRRLWTFTTAFGHYEDRKAMEEAML